MRCRAFLAAHPEIVSRWLDAHVELTRRLANDAPGATRALNAEIEHLTGKAFPAAVLTDAWSRMTITWDPIRESLAPSADAAFRLGFLGDRPPHLDGIYDLDTSWPLRSEHITLVLRNAAANAPLRR